MKNNTIRILKQGKILISRDLLRKIKTPFVEVLIDEDYNKLALKPSKDEIRGYKIFNSNILQVAPLKHGQLGEFQARFTEGKVIVDSYKVNPHIANLEYYEDEPEIKKIIKNHRRKNGIRY